MAKAKKGKTPHPIPVVENDQKNQNSPEYAFFDYQCSFTGVEKPMSLQGIERLAQELLIWARDEKEATKLSKFYLGIKGIHPDKWYEWISKYPTLKRANEAAKLLIGNRREDGALNRKYDSATILRSMSIYDPEWKDLEVWRATLREQQKNESTGPQIVVIETMPTTDAVPARKATIIKVQQDERVDTD